MSGRLPSSPFLYPLTDRALGAASLDTLACELYQAGAPMLQLRDKQLGDGEFLAAARIARATATRSGGLLFVNDRLDVALLAGADGIHLGEEDLPVAEVRKLAGARLRIGRSSHGLDAALAVAALGVDYVALGPIFPSATKPGRDALGVEVIRAFKQRSSVPLVAIGGIDAGRIAEVVDAGADGIAVIAAVMVAGRVQERCRELVGRIRA